MENFTKEKNNENQNFIGLKKIKESFKVFGPIGALSGFVSDVITPIAPVIDYLAIGLIFITILLALLYYFKKKENKIFQYARFFPHSIVLTIVIGGFALAGVNSENGYFADNFESVSNMQSSIFNIEKGINRIEGKVDDMKSDISEIKSAVTVKMSDIDNRLMEIEKKISGGVLIENPSNLEEYLINCMICYNNANYKEAELLFDKIFALEYYKYDLAYLYYEVLLNNYNSDIERIAIKLKGSKFYTQSNYFKLAEMEHNLTGIDYFIKLSKVEINDNDLKAFMENVKAKSFYVSVQSYPSMNDLIGFWTPIFVQNQKTLGLKINKAKRLFFDYSSTYKRYLSNTSYSNDENTVFNFYQNSYTQKENDIKKCRRAWEQLISK